MASGVDLEYYDITLEEFLPYFIEHMESQLSPSTIRTSLQAINSKEIGIKKFFGNKKMRQIKNEGKLRILNELDSQTMYDIFIGMNLSRDEISELYDIHYKKDGLNGKSIFKNASKRSTQAFALFSGDAPSSLVIA